MLDKFEDRKACTILTHSYTTLNQNILFWSHDRQVFEIFVARKHVEILDD